MHWENPGCTFPLFCFKKSCDFGAKLDKDCGPRNELQGWEWVACASELRTMTRCVHVLTLTLLTGHIMVDCTCNGHGKRMTILVNDNSKLEPSYNSTLVK